MSADVDSLSLSPAATAGDLHPSRPDSDPDQDGRSLFEAARAAGRDVRPGRATRADGWTPERIAIFLNALAETGFVTEAARAAGMSGPSAYGLRNSAKGQSFALAWDAALLRASPSLNQTLTSRAIHGWDEPVFRDGKICGHRRRYDNRLAMRLLHWHERRAASDRRAAAVRLVADEFEQFVGIVARGGEGAADFVGQRLLVGKGDFDEAELLERADNYVRYGAGLAREIDVSDLDPAKRASWTEEQAERARRAGLLDPLEEQQEQDPGDDPPHRGGSHPE